MRVNGKKIYVGDMVRIIRDCREHVPVELHVNDELATYMGICWCHNGLRYRGSTDQFLRVNPKFRLADGSIIWGIECWWISLAEEENATKLLSSELLSGSV